jgi:hypothetical protein
MNNPIITIKKGFARRNSLLFAALIFLSLSSVGAQVVVNSTGDGGLVYGGKYGCESDLLRGGVCTVRAAIQYANLNPDVTTITFSISTSDHTVILRSALPDLSTDMKITGPGANGLVVEGGGAFIRIFNVGPAASVNISGLTITSGRNGGLVNIYGGTVTLSNCTLRNNSGSAVFNATGGTVSISNSTLTDNVNSEAGGAISNSGKMNVTGCTIRRNLAGIKGGGVYNSGNLTLTNTTVADNRVVVAADYSPSIVVDAYGGGISSNAGTLTLTNCTVSGNAARGREGDGGGYAYGGGIFSDNDVLTITSCTVFGNSTEGGNNLVSASGAAFGGGIAHVTGTFNLSNSTISGNWAISGCGTAAPESRGGGIWGRGTIKTTIVAGNSATTSGPDVFGSFVSRGFNLIGKVAGGTGFTAATDLKGTITSPLDPKLGPLQNNGGRTQSMGLLPGSPAIDKGTSVSIAGTTLSTDQRGAGFPRKFDNLSIANAVGGDGTDIGAFERQTP